MLFLDNEIQPLPGERVVIFAARQGGRVGGTGGGFQDGKLRLGDRCAGFVNPGQGVVVVRGANIDQSALVLDGSGVGGLGGVDHVGHLLDFRNERRISVDGIFPDLISIGSQVDLGVAIIVENAILFGVQVA